MKGFLILFVAVEIINAIYSVYSGLLSQWSKIVLTTKIQKIAVTLSIFIVISIIFALIIMGFYYIKIGG